MSRNRILYILFALLTATLAASAAQPVEKEISVEEDVLIIESSDPAKRHDERTGNRRLRFAWGAEIAGGVEMSGHDMSTIGLNASFGLSCSWIRFLGVTAEADIAVDSSSRAIPLSLNFRTDFSKRRRLLFMDLRGGMVLNYFADQPQTQNPYASAGVGVTLAAGRTFASHLIVAYTYHGRETCTIGNYERPCPGMSFVSMRLGVAF